MGGVASQIRQMHARRRGPDKGRTLKHHQVSNIMTPVPVLEVYGRPGAFSLVMASLDDTPTLKILIPGGYRLTDRRGQEVVTPGRTQEPLTADQLVTSTRRGEHGFVIVGERTPARD